MFSALEALLTLGKCRELPVVGFVNGVMIMGVIVSPLPLETGLHLYVAYSRMKSHVKPLMRLPNHLLELKLPSRRFSRLPNPARRNAKGHTSSSSPTRRLVRLGQYHKKAIH